MSSATLGAATAHEPPRGMITTGALVFVISDALIFAALLGGALALRSQGRDWPAGGVATPAQLAIFTALLFGASAALVLGRRARMFLLAAGLLGALFVAAEVREWRVLLHEGMGPSADLHHASLFVVTGLHALHVVAGVAALAWLALRRAGEQALRVLTIYWAALDVAWVAIVATLYAS